jgi:hypothetical protein
VPFTTYLEFWTYRRMEQADNVRWSVTWTESFEAFAPSISSFAISGNELGTRFLKIGNTSLYLVVLQASNADLLHAAPTYAQAANSKRLSMN